MQGRIATVAIVLLAGCFVPLGASSQGGLHFGTPASFGGAVVATGSQWAIALMDGPGATAIVNETAELSLREIVVHSVGEHRLENNTFGGHRWETENAEPASLPASFGMDSIGPSSLYTEGMIGLAVDDVEAAIEIPPTACLNSLLRTQDVNFTTRSDKICPPSWPAVVVLLRKNTEFSLEGTNLTRLEWHGMKTSCATTNCPPGGSREETSAPLPSPNYLRVRTHSFENAVGAGGHVNAHGQARALIFGGTLLDLQVQGWLRLPLASGSTSCASCIGPANQTFFAAGNLSLQDLSVGQDGRLQGDVAGDYSTVRFDEAAMDPRLLRPALEGAAVVATGLGLALLAKFVLWPLFTRRAEDQLLQNDRRRRLFEVIEQHPGIHFREALRLAGLPSGSGRFHLSQLVRNGLLIERHVGRNLRLFARNAVTKGDWAASEAQRDERLRPIVDWVAEHPDCSQKEILEALRASREWNPSTTQGRLARLVKNGVLQCTPSGRGRNYRLTRPLVDASAATVRPEAVHTAG